MSKVFDDDKVKRIIKIWQRDGENIIEGSGGAPYHPEYIFRKSGEGEWRGWNDFLDISESEEEYIENFEQDLLETHAFKKMCH